MYIFGGGDAFVVPYSGSLAANPSPMPLYALQETTIDISASTKPLMGKTQFPLAVARTEGKITAKVKFAAEYAKIWNDAFWGSAGVLSTGGEFGVARSPQTLTSHACTISPPNSGTFARDMGVVDVTSGRAMYVVASNPTAGVSYTISSNTYTFATGQGAVEVSYTYTLTTGFQSVVSNVAMGSQPVLNFTVMNSQYVNFDGATNVLFQFPAVIGSKISSPFKYNDWWMCEMDLEVFANNSGIVLYTNFDE